MTSFRPFAVLDVVSASLPATWNFISLACVHILVLHPHLISSRLLALLPLPMPRPLLCTPLLDGLTFFTSFSILQTPVAPVLSLNLSFLSSASFPLDNLPRVPWVSFPKYNL